MGLGIRAIASAFGQCARRLERILVGNLLAALIGAPVFIVSGLAAFWSGQVGVGAVVAAILFGVLPNPAAAGLQLTTRDMAAGEFLLMPGPLEGVRLYWRVAFKFWLIGLPITVVLIFNCIFYTQVHFTGSSLAELGALYLLLAWLAVHVYVYPLIIEQEVKKVRLVYRNAFVIAFLHPVFTLQVLVAWLLVLVVTSASGLVVAIGLGLAASIQQNATARMLPTFAQEDARERDPAIT